MPKDEYRNKFPKRKRGKVKLICPICGGLNLLDITITKPKTLYGKGSAKVECSSCNLSETIRDVTFIDEKIDVYGKLIDQLSEIKTAS